MTEQSEQKRTEGTMEVRLVGPGDSVRLQAFFRRIPEGDRTFFKEDVLDEASVASWTTDARARRVVALGADGEVAGYGAVIPGVGWSGHVGELRLVIAPERRRAGLGRELARRCLLEALDLGLTKLVVEVVADQAPAVAMFQALGFVPEALLRNHVRDRSGALRDLVLLAHSVDENWSAMATAGIDEALA